MNWIASLKKKPGQSAALVGVFIMFLLAITRVVAGANDLTSSGTFGAALRLAAPIGLVGLGALLSERAGILNIGLEANMILGTWAAGWAGFEYGPWVGVIAAIIGGLLGALVHAVLTIHLRIDQVMSGVVLIILVPGITRFLSTSLWQGRKDAAATLGPPIEGDLGRFTFPFLAGGRIGSWRSPDMFGWFEKKDIFLISDIAGLAKALTFDLSWLVLFAMAAFPLVWFMLYRTPFGLRLRSVGESPNAADSLGVNVYAMRYSAVLMSGALSGLAGAILVLATGSNQYKEGQTGGRGFIGIAAMIFGNWRPGGLAVGSGLFGFADALQLRSNESVRGLFFLVFMLLSLAAAWALYKRKVVNFVLSAGLAAGSLTYYLITDKVPSQFVNMTPYAVTLVVLLVAAQRLRPPRAAGTPWSKGGS
jgi:general nucleoside transport system permease protein